MLDKKTVCFWPLKKFNERGLRLRSRRRRAGPPLKFSKRSADGCWSCPTSSVLPGKFKHAQSSVRFEGFQERALHRGAGGARRMSWSDPHLTQ
jgi:hypothetical protein